MQTNRFRVVAAFVLLIALPYIYAAAFVLIEKHWLPRDEHAHLVAAVLIAPVLILAWFGVWFGRVVWNRRRVVLTFLATACSLALVSAVLWTWHALQPRAEQVSGPVGFGLFAFFWLLAMALIWPATPRERMDRLRRDGIGRLECPKCKYDMQGLRQSACPECGAEFTLDELYDRVLRNHEEFGGALHVGLENLRETARFMIRSTVVLMVLLLGAAGVLQLWATRERQEAMRDWQAAGGITSIRQMMPAPIPDDQDAASLLRELVALTDQIEAERSLTMDYDADPLRKILWEVDGHDEAHLAEAVQLYAPAIALARAAAARPAYVWATPDSSDPQLLAFEPVFATRTAASLLLLQSEVESRRGNHDESFRLLANALRLGDLAIQQPLLTGALVGHSIDGLVLHQAQQQFRHVPMPDDALIRHMQGRDWHAITRDAMRAEGAALMELATDELEIPPRDRWPATIARDFDIALALRHMTANVRAMDPANTSPPPAPPAVMVVAFMPLTRAACPWFSCGPVRDTIDQSDLGREMFRTAHRLRRYRAEHGAYPPEADFDAPPDPWSKGFLQYQRVGDGFALWSLRTDAAGEWITWLWDADELPEPIRPPPSPSNEVDWSEGD